MDHKFSIGIQSERQLQSPLLSPQLFSAVHCSTVQYSMHSRAHRKPESAAQRVGVGRTAADTGIAPDGMKRVESNRTESNRSCREIIQCASLLSFCLCAALSPQRSARRAPAAFSAPLRTAALLCSALCAQRVSSIRRGAAPHRTLIEARARDIGAARSGADRFLFTSLHFTSLLLSSILFASLLLAHRTAPLSSSYEYITVYPFVPRLDSTPIQFSSLQCSLTPLYYIRRLECAKLRVNSTQSSRRFQFNYSTLQYTVLLYRSRPATGAFISARRLDAFEAQAVPAEAARRLAASAPRRRRRAAREARPKGRRPAADDRL